MPFSSTPYTAPNFLGPIHDFNYPKIQVNRSCFATNWASLPTGLFSGSLLLWNCLFSFFNQISIKLKPHFETTPFLQTNQKWKRAFLIIFLLLIQLIFDHENFRSHKLNQNVFPDEEAHTRPPLFHKKRVLNHQNMANWKATSLCSETLQDLSLMTPLYFFLKISLKCQKSKECLQVIVEILHQFFKCCNKRLTTTTDSKIHSLLYAPNTSNVKTSCFVTIHSWNREAVLNLSQRTF